MHGMPTDRFVILMAPELSIEGLPLNSFENLYHLSGTLEVVAAGKISALGSRTLNDELPHFLFPGDTFALQGATLDLHRQITNPVSVQIVP